MITLYVRCQTKDYILDIAAARAGMRINKVNSVKQLILYVIVCPIFFVAAKLIGQQKSFEFSFKYTGRNFVNTCYTNFVNA